MVQSRDEMTPAFLKPAPVAWYGTHRHGAGGDEPYVFTYLFRHVLPVPVGATTLVLPDDPRVRLFGATLAAGPGDVPDTPAPDDDAGDVPPPQGRTAVGCQGGPGNGGAAPLSLLLLLVPAFARPWVARGGGPPRP